MWNDIGVVLISWFVSSTVSCIHGSPAEASRSGTVSLCCLSFSKAWQDMEKSNTNRSSKHKIVGQGIRCQHARSTQALIFKSSFNLLHHTLLTSPQNDFQILSQFSLDEGTAMGKRDSPLLPAWQTGIQDTISWFVAGAHQWLLIPLKAGWFWIGMTPHTHSHTQQPSNINPGPRF